MDQKIGFHFTTSKEKAGKIGLPIDKGYHIIPRVFKSQIGFWLFNLTEFTQCYSTKVIVFVTDDESDWSSSRTLNELSEFFPLSQTKVFGFIALDSSDDNCKADEGDNYIAMASATGGSVFDICAQDWSSHFTDLSDQVSYAANNKFKLNHENIEKIRQVKVNGNLISPNVYSLVGDELVINFNAQGLLDSEVINIEVVYEIVE